MTSSPIDGIQGTIDEAFSSSEPDDAIRIVKTAVLEELQQLDPRSSVEYTPYFSHSFVPDFVVRWSEGGRDQRRDVYLRPSVESTIAAQDVKSLGDRSPVLLSLRRADQATYRAEADIREEISVNAPNVMLAGVATIEEFTEPAVTDNEPLRALIRPNLIRGGRGVISRETASVLRSPLTGTSADVARLESFSNVVRTIFVEDAATRLERAAQLLEVGLTGDTSALIQDLDSDPSSGVIGGRLSEAEMEVLLPFLLRREDVTTDSTFWAHLGSMIDLGRLENMRSLLEDVDLTPLLDANKDVWAASRATLVLNASVDDQDAPPDGSWRFFGRTIANVRGTWRVHVTSNNTRLRGRDDSPAVPWEQLQPALRGRRLSAVVLKGVQRTVNVSADQAADVVADVAAIRDSIADDFFVPSLTVKASLADDASRVEVDFKRLLATALPATSVGGLIEISLDLLGRAGTESSDPSAGGDR